MKNLLLGIIAINLTIISINLTLRSIEPTYAQITSYEIRNGVQKGLDGCNLYEFAASNGYSFSC